MRKILKWIGIVLAALVGLLVMVVAGLSISSNSRLNKTYTIQPETVDIPTDEAAIAEGERLASIYCAGCHGDNLGGTDFFNEPAIAVFDAANLTTGSSGVGSYFTDEDWVRAIRHGVDAEGKPLFIMPSKDFYYFSDEDLGQIIAFLKAAPPVDNDANDFQMGFMGRLLLAVGAFGDVINAETIDHTAARPHAPIPAASAEYGSYLVQTVGCSTCHGENLTGGTGPEPGAPPGPDITATGNLGSWAEADFILQMRARKSEFMPFESLAKMSDEELSAIYLYLQSLP